MDKPPMRLNPIIDKKGGFTTLTRLNEELWRSYVVLAGRDRTTLQRADPDTYEGKPAVKAYYRLGGYCCQIIAWFDAVTGERLD